MKRFIVISIAITLAAMACTLAPAADTAQDQEVDAGPQTDADAGADTHADAGMDLDAGLVARYPLDSNADDVSGNELHGQPFNLEATSGALGADAGGMRFNGADSIVTIPDDDLLDLRGDFSISFYIKGNSQSDHEWLILTKHMAGVCQPEDTSWMLRYSADFGLRLVNYDTSEDCGKTILNAPDVDLLDDLWHQIIIVHDSREQSISLYADGILVVEADASRLNIQNNDAPLVIGNQTNGVPQHALDAALDDLRIYDRALGEEAVQALYNLGR